MTLHSSLYTSCVEGLPSCVLKSRLKSTARNPAESAIVTTATTRQGLLAHGASSVPTSTVPSPHYLCPSRDGARPSLILPRDTFLCRSIFYLHALLRRSNQRREKRLLQVRTESGGPGWTANGQQPGHWLGYAGVLPKLYYRLECTSWSSAANTIRGERCHRN